MGTDKKADVLWVGNSWGANLARINTRTHETTYVPLPRPAAALSRSGRQQSQCMDQSVGRGSLDAYGPRSGTWTAFDLPTRGAEPRYISLLEREGQPTQVVAPYFRARKIAVITLRSEADLQAAKTAAERQ